MKTLLIALTLTFCIALFASTTSYLQENDRVSPDDWPEAWEFHKSTGLPPSWDLTLTKHNAKYLSKFMDNVSNDKPKKEKIKRVKKTKKERKYNIPLDHRSYEYYPKKPVRYKDVRKKVNKKMYRQNNNRGHLRWDSALFGKNAADLVELLDKENDDKYDSKSYDNNVDYY